MSGEMILYQTEDGLARISLRAVDGTVWLTQAEIAQLFDSTPQAITQHIKAIYAEGELVEAATCNELLQVRQEGARQVQRRLKSCSLTHAGRLQADVAKRLAEERFDVFDAARPHAEALAADADDFASIEAMARDLPKGTQGK